MVKYEGKTIEEAISKGLEELVLTKEMVTITTITEARKGFLGFGRQLAVVDIQPLASNYSVHSVLSTDIPTKPIIENEEEDENSQQAIENIATYLETIVSEMGESATITTAEKNKQVFYNIETSNPGLVIGKHGKVLNALQYLAQVHMHRTALKKWTVVVDVGDYRLRREEKLKRIAEHTAHKVQSIGQPVFLDPMPSFERKQIHALLADYENIATHSEGEEPFRYLVVEYKKETSR